MLGINGHKKLNGLPSIQRIEENSWDVDLQICFHLSTEGEESMLTIETSKDSRLFGNLKHSQVGILPYRGEAKLLFRNHDHGPWYGR